LEWLVDADAVRDAKRAVESGDLRLLAIRGYTITTPGVPEDKTRTLRSVNGVRFIEGTSDVIVNEKHRKLLEVAQEYAREYNEYVVASTRKL
jgi:hypothetical protein